MRELQTPLTQASKENPHLNSNTPIDRTRRVFPGNRSLIGDTVPYLNSQVSEGNEVEASEKNDLNRVQKVLHKSIILDYYKKIKKRKKRTVYRLHVEKKRQ